MPIQLQRIAACCAALILSAVAVPSHAQQIVVSKDNRTIAVTTSADANADADTVTVQIGFVAYGRRPGLGLRHWLQDLECHRGGAQGGWNPAGCHSE